MDFHSCAICKTLDICDIISRDPLRPDTPAMSKRTWGTHTLKKAGSAWLRSWSLGTHRCPGAGSKSTHGQENLNPTLSVPTAGTLTCVPPLLPPQDTCQDCAGWDWTPSSPAPCLTHAGFSDDKHRAKEGANVLIPLQVYFLSFQLGGILSSFFFFSLCSTAHLIAFSSVISTVEFWSCVNHCHSKHFVVPQSAVSVQTAGEAPLVLI